MNKTCVLYWSLSSVQTPLIAHRYQHGNAHGHGTVPQLAVQTPLKMFQGERDRTVEPKEALGYEVRPSLKRP